MREIPDSCQQVNPSSPAAQNVVERRNLGNESWADGPISLANSTATSIRMRGAPIRRSRVWSGASPSKCGTPSMDEEMVGNPAKVLCEVQSNNTPSHASDLKDIFVSLSISVHVVRPQRAESHYEIFSAREMGRTALPLSTARAPQIAWRKQDWLQKPKLRGERDVVSSVSRQYPAKDREKPCRVQATGYKEGIPGKWEAPKRHQTKSRDRMAQRGIWTRPRTCNGYCGAPQREREMTIQSTSWSNRDLRCRASGKVPSIWTERLSLRSWEVLWRSVSTQSGCDRIEIACSWKPSIGFHHIFNFSNFDLPTGTMSGLLTGTAGPIKRTDPTAHDTNRAAWVL